MPRHWIAPRTLVAAPVSASLLLAFVGQTPAAAADDPWMTAEQIRKCVSLEISKDEREGEMDRRKRAMDYANERFENSKLALARSRAALDSSNARDLAGFNERVAAHNALLDESDARTDAFNEAVREFNAALAAFNPPCTGIRYKPKDWLLEKDRQLQARRQQPAQ